MLRRAIVLAARAAVPGGKLGFIIVESEGVQRIDGELQAAHHFVFDLLRRAENMRVVLREAAHAHQAVHHARSLVAIHRAQFAQPHRKIAIAVQLVFVNQNVARAVHRLELILGVVQLHGLEHVVAVEIGVPGNLPQIAPHDVRRVDQRVAARQVLIAHPVFDDLANAAALGMEENQAGSGEFLDAEQVQLLAELAMIALLGFFQALQVGVLILLVEKRGAVDALQARIVLVALPISAGDR